MLQKLGAFVRLSRFKFLIGGLAGGALGTAVALFERGAVSLRAYLVAQFAVTAAHYMTQLCNEYFDRESDARTERTPYSGGSGALVDGSLAPRVALYAALAALAASAAGAIALLAAGHGLAALLAFAIIPLAWAYSAPPVRLLARGLGELDAMLVVAVLVPLCTYAAQTNALDARAVATTFAGTAAMLAMMIAVQIPDLRADASTAKRNLVVRLGAPRAARVGIASLLAIVVAVDGTRAFGVPTAYRACEVVSLLPIALLANAFLKVALGRRFDARGVAMLGVGVFTTVTALGMLAYVLATHAVRVT